MNMKKKNLIRDILLVLCIMGMLLTVLSACNNRPIHARETPNEVRIDGFRLSWRTDQSHDNYFIIEITNNQQDLQKTVYFFQSFGNQILHFDFERLDFNYGLYEIRVKALGFEHGGGRIYLDSDWSETVYIDFIQQQQVSNFRVYAHQNAAIFWDMHQGVEYNYIKLLDNNDNVFLHSPNNSILRERIGVMSSAYLDECGNYTLKVRTNEFYVTNSTRTRTTVYTKPDFASFDFEFSMRQNILVENLMLGVQFGHIHWDIIEIPNQAIGFNIKLLSSNDEIIYYDHTFMTGIDISQFLTENGTYTFKVQTRTSVPFFENDIIYGEGALSDFVEITFNVIHLT